MADSIVLAYSGGLDTSCILRILSQQGWKVIAFIADVGQHEDFDLVQRRAEQIGASKIVLGDLKREFVTDYIFPAVAGNAIYENNYLLGTSLARPLIARRQVEVALQLGATAVAHGATGKGNDQVRFEFAYAALAPQLKVVAPWKDKSFLSRFKGRRDLIQFAADEKIPIDATLEKPYSIDENLMHTSFESGILEDPATAPLPEMFRRTRNLRDTPHEPNRVEIHFKDAMPIMLREVESGAEFRDPLQLFVRLNELAGMHGVGRIDIVENRFVGIKSRGVYETPAGTVLHKALRDLEGIAMDREVLRLRDGLAPKFAELIYNGYWYSPEMDFLRAGFAQAERLIDGHVTVELFKGNATILGRSSPSSLYNRDLSSMDVSGGYNQEDAAGFIKINALRLKAHKIILRGAGEA